MANQQQQQQQPAHDFAPAWLKIPTYDTASSDHHSSRSEEHRQALHHRRSVGNLRSGFQGDIFRDLGGRQQSPPFAVRHASMDAEDRLFHQAGGGPPSRAAQPPRRPHSRHDFRDFPPSSHHKMSPNAVVQCGGDNCVNTVCAEASPAASQHDKKDLTGNNFNQEFPTLLGAEEPPVQQPAVTNGSVWENPRNSRVHGTVLRKGHLVQRPRPDPSASALLETRSRSPGSTTGGGVVTPAVALSPKLGRTTGLTGSAPATARSSASASQNSLYRALLPSSNKAKGGGPLAHAMEVLVKKQPRTKGGNKGDFLKALRCCKEDEEAKGAGGDVATLLHDRTNGHIQVGDSQSSDDQGADLESSACDVGKLSLESPEHPPLSSSLEAEQRLLREMGWKEEASDDDAYAPLTEDELREFQYLTKIRQEKQQQQQRNGSTQRAITAALPDRASLWSPRRACSQAYAGLVMGNGWSSSSSSSDTESDGN